MTTKLNKQEYNDYKEMASWIDGACEIGKNIAWAYKESAVAATSAAIEAVFDDVPALLNGETASKVGTALIKTVIQTVFDDVPALLDIKGKPASQKARSVARTTLNANFRTP